MYLALWPFALIAALAMSLPSQPPACQLEADVGFVWICRRCVVSPQEDGTLRFGEPPSVAEIAPDGPASRLLRNGDRVLAVDEQPITTAAAAGRLARLRPGDVLSLQIERGAEITNVRLTVGVRCQEPKAPTPRDR
jgi:hypothetical protein